MRGSMRDFGTACGEKSLQVEIAVLDACGFADESNVAWNGDALWTAFKHWQSQGSKSQRSEIGDKPDLYQSQH